MAWHGHLFSPISFPFLPLLPLLPSVHPPFNPSTSTLTDFLNSPSFFLLSLPHSHLHACVRTYMPAPTPPSIPLNPVRKRKQTHAWSSSAGGVRCNTKAAMKKRQRTTDNEQRTTNNEQQKNRKEGRKATREKRKREREKKVLLQPLPPPLLLLRRRRRRTAHHGTRRTGPLVRV
ncbi:hypothetical protein BC567DRAFT_44955 [Phyllosticta citribraziliensis]